MWRNGLRAAITLFVVLLPQVVRSQDGGVQIFITGNNWAPSTGNIWRLVANTGQVDLIYTVDYDDGRPMMANSIGDTLYWTTFYPGQLWKKDSLGSTPQLLVDQGENTTTRAVEFKDGKIYWANEVLGAIYKCNPDGSEVDVVVSGYFNYSYGFWDFVIVGDRVYWTSWDSALVKSLDLDGTNYQEFTIFGVSRIFSIEASDERLILSDTSDSTAPRIVSTALNGTDVQVLAGPIVGVAGLSGLAVHDDRAYFVTADPAPPLGQWTRVESVALSGGTVQLEFETMAFQAFQIHVAPYFTPFIRGDSNQDALVDIGDAVYSLAHLFGPGPSICLDAHDVNDDGQLDIADPIYLLTFLMADGPAIAAPSPACGSDSSADALDCGDHICP